MNILKAIYKVFRSIVMSLIVLGIVVYSALYILLSVPSVQLKVKEKACREASAFLGGTLEAGSLSIRPFSEVLLSDVWLASPEGEKCIEISRIAAGIDLWTLLTERKIVFNYAEIIGLDAGLRQAEKGGPLNIQFLIDALSPKDKSKAPAAFDLRFRNIVVRRSRASFSRPWLMSADSVPLPLADVRLSGLRLDLSIPELKNDLYRFAVRNMQCEVNPGVSVRSFAADITFRKDAAGVGNDSLSVKGLRIVLPNSALEVADFSMPLPHPFPADAGISGTITPSDLREIVPVLATFDSKWKIDADAGIDTDRIDVRRLRLSDMEGKAFLDLNACIDNYARPDSLTVGNLKLGGYFPSALIARTLQAIPMKSARLRDILLNAGDVGLDIAGDVDMKGESSISGKVTTGVGDVRFETLASALLSKRPAIKANVDIDDLEVGDLLNIPRLGSTSLALDANITGLDAGCQGDVSLLVDYVELNARRFEGIELFARKRSDDFRLSLSSDDGNLPVLLNADGHLGGADSYIDADIEIDGFNPAQCGIQGKFADSDLSGIIKLYAKGDNLDNVTGFLKVSDFEMKTSDRRVLPLENLTLTIDSISDAPSSSLKTPLKRMMALRSDWLDADIEGLISPRSLVRELSSIAASVVPSLIQTRKGWNTGQPAENDFTFNITVKGESSLFDFLNAPVRPLADIPLSGFVNAAEGKCGVKFDTPYLQQGKNKLIRNVKLDASVDSFTGMADIAAEAIVPVKNGELHADASVHAVYDMVNANVALNPGNEKGMHGNVALSTSFSRTANPLKPKGDLAVHAELIPTSIIMNSTVWNIAGGKIDYIGKKIEVSDFLVSNGNQFVKIFGTASESASDELIVKLNEIDLDYIFGLLNINYVSFGGMATGEVSGRRLLSSRPIARTQFLNVRGLKYNDALLGDASLASDYDAQARKVAIYAVIRDPLSRERRATVDGGIWVTRDSLSFDFDANRLDIKFMKPYMSAFCSDLVGRGSGKCKLYGTFKDIDLTGALKADTLSMKLDFTNTWYHAGEDSVYLTKGLIDIPPLTLYDDFGNRANLSGWVSHEYFHNPSFSFRIKDAEGMLCYDTNEKINPLWYGTIFGSGNVNVDGRPGLVDIDINMTTCPGSKFWYVISDTEEVEQYSFLTFTDRRKAQIASAAPDTIPDYLHRFLKKNDDSQDLASNVILSIKGTVTSDALVTLIMDPKGGDKITAHGQGALQMDYNMAGNDLRMIGTYVLDEGNYNFTLQDIIIKNFVIKKGSSIKFDGDPMAANLDIAATYRVNTNLTDLDKSFAEDKELNRTNVPVDALLLVKGPMTHPDITFDIELPSVSSDVERKVRSIVSTNDMMNRQIIYLLALNRFYTPEYTSGDKGVSGSEWSSMASSTISSQLSNMLSQMTDKLSVAPSFRSDRGDFSDMEFDLALSSRLLNNRLLVNGNFGYRDRHTSNTQFVGDFDIEYLLNRNGNLRLKAYNHFNDQNYYLRSALTTQGVGVVYTKDFDHLFRRMKDGKDTRQDPRSQENADSLKIETIKHREKDDMEN